MSRSKIFADRERVTFASELVAQMTPEQRATVTADRMAASFGVTITQAERILKMWRK